MRQPKQGHAAVVRNLQLESRAPLCALIFRVHRFLHTSRHRLSRQHGPGSLAKTATCPLALMPTLLFLRPRVAHAQEDQGGNTRELLLAFTSKEDGPANMA